MEELIMPNWAEGVLKLRGTRSDIKNFLENGFEAIDTHAAIRSFIGGDQKEPNKIEVELDEWEMNLKSPEGLYIKGTRRAFIDGAIEWYFRDKHTEVLSIENFKQAWGVDAESFTKISKLYNLDMKIYVFERGMEFNQDIEIHKGEVIKNKEIEFEDYEWECLFPNLGG
jgi:hypothetical protein